MSCRACLVVLALAGAATAAAENLFTNAYFVNPTYQAELDTSIAGETDKTIRRTLAQMRGVGSAYWIDKKEKIRGKNDTRTLEGILYAASRQSPAPLVVAIVYDLPNRDCNAHASNGEICCRYNDDGTCDYTGDECAAGLAEYESGYVDVFAEVLAEYADSVPVALVIEPDSVGNLVTNADDPKCGSGATQAAIEAGVPYAIQTLKAACADCAIYLDAAHGGWLGWENNLDDFVARVAGFGVLDALRGFATNVANYQPLGELCPEGLDCIDGDDAARQHACCADPCDSLGQWNRANNELNYARMLVDAVAAATGADARVIIDTGRNGVADERADCSNWCNIRGAGVGQLPTHATANASFIDAYFWLKTPGESDGCTQTLPDPSDAWKANGTCPRFDTGCASPDSLGALDGEPFAPEAGAWFDYQIKQLAQYAVFASGAGDADDGGAAPVSEPTALPTAEPTRDGGECADDYQRCGGVDWDGTVYGPFSCCSGAECVHNSDAYWQCTPPKATA